MVDLERTRSEPEKQLWEQLSNIHAGMLGIDGSSQHMQPMAPKLDRENATIWFYTRKGSPFTQIAADRARAQFCVISNDHDYHACISGSLRQLHDRAMIDHFWAPSVAAWFEGGKDDPALTMLALSVQKATIWASSSNRIMFGWEIAKANLTDDRPDIGLEVHITF